MPGHLTLRWILLSSFGFTGLGGLDQLTSSECQGHPYSSRGSWYKQTTVSHVHCPCPDFTPSLDFIPSVTKAISTGCTLARYAGLRGRKDLSCPLSRVDTRLSKSSRRGTVPGSTQWIIASPGPLVLPLLPTLQHRRGAKVQNGTFHWQSRTECCTWCALGKQ